MRNASMSCARRAVLAESKLQGKEYKNVCKSRENNKKKIYQLDHICEKGRRAWNQDLAMAK